MSTSAAQRVMTRARAGRLALIVATLVAPAAACAGSDASSTTRRVTVTMTVTAPAPAPAVGVATSADSAVAADYVFRTVWRVAGTVAEVRDVLADGVSLPRWWPAVYLSVDVVREAGDDGCGGELALSTTGWLPYTLRWTLRVTEPVTDTGFALTAAGDLVGTGRWTFAERRAIPPPPPPTFRRFTGPS